MPSSDTFSIQPIKEFVKRHLNGVSIDPFARNSRFATYTNDLNPNTLADYHMDAVEFLKMIADDGIKADCVIFDPPYSPRQIVECYHEAGLTPKMKDTQSARFKADCRDQIRRIVKHGGIVLNFGWNTVGHGPEFEIEELMIVCHGGDHNDTLCFSERRVSEQISMAI